MTSLTGGTGYSQGNATGSLKAPKAPSGYRSYSQFTPEQQQLFQQLFSHVGQGSYLSRLAGGDQSLFGEMEAPALRQFSGLQGNLASRFSGMGLGGRHSSGFQNTATAAASDFAQDLQARRQALQQQALRDLTGISSELLGQRPFGLVQKPQEESSGWGGLLGAGLGAAGGFFAGGPVGALRGASLGYGVGNQLF